MRSTAIVTGCNRGLGQGIKDVLLTNNFKVIGLNKTPANDINRDYTDYFLNLSQEIPLDLVNHLPQKIDLLVLNAGIRRFGEVGDLSREDWNESVQVNFTSVFQLVSLLKDRIVESKGDIIFVGSHSEKYSFEGGAAYCSTKLAIKGLANCLIDELRFNDVRISYLSIGSIRNRDHGGDESWKLDPIDVGETILSLVKLPKKVLVPYLDVRPLKPLKDHLTGMERLQYV